LAFAYEKEEIEPMLYRMFEREGVIDNLDSFFKGLLNE
jgi:hypothetical protein